MTREVMTPTICFHKFLYYIWTQWTTTTVDAQIMIS